MRAGLVAAVCVATWAISHAAALPTTSRVLYAAVPACIEDSTQAACKTYMYPDDLAQADIADNCVMMTDMVGCTIHRLCKEGKVKGQYCTPMAILATLCGDMPGMSPCRNYTALCKAGSVVQQCQQNPAPPSVPHTEPTKAAILEACGSHAMPACDTCRSGPAGCPDVLGTVAALCRSMPSMSQCAPFFAFCSANSAPFSALCAGGGREYLPSMKMYFHQRVAEMILWRDWIPSTPAKYAGAVIAVMCFAVLSQALKVARLLLEARWAAQLKPRPRACGSPMAAVSATKSADELLPGMATWKRLLREGLMTSGQLRRSAARSLFQGAASVLDYFNMLVVMTFNVGLFCGVVAGYMLGTLLFSHLLESRPAAPQPDPLPFAATVTATQQEEEEQGCCCTPANLEIGCGC